MSKIRIMSEALSNRIAAGEVIERPASVVKELVENAIDAGASMITVEIERAGSRLISVSDDGSGMDADDVLLALEPHGTSKLIDESQINGIVTMGFRGEALPSIASISRLELFSRTADSTEGTVLRVDGGRMLESAPAGGKVGTSVRVRDLFFNTPARKKFLKSAATEAHHIDEMVQALALGHPGVGFSLRTDGRTAFNVPAESREDRLRELFGRDFVRRMLALEHREGGMTVSGFVAEPGFTRVGRREQRCYINGRAVEALAVYRGIRDGYGMIGFESGRLPPVVLFIEMPPGELDVNVHPAKREVRFKSEFAVARLVESAVRMALRRNLEAGNDVEKPLDVILNPLPGRSRTKMEYVLDGAAISYEPRRDEAAELPLPPPKATEEPSLPPLPGPDAEFCNPPSPPAELSDRPEEPDEKSARPETPEISSVAELSESDSDGDWPEAVLGIFDRSYILCAGKHGLLIVDQHAAHERVMFEALLDEYHDKKCASQALLLPAVLELPHPELSLLLRNRKVFERIGFEFEPAGGTTVLLSAIPVRLGSRRSPEELVPDMLEMLLDDAGARLPVEGEYVARAACHAAVRAHDELTEDEAGELLRQLRNCRQGRLCPHGRPTIITITRRELEKRFLRR